MVPWLSPIHFPSEVREDDGKTEMGSFFPGLRVHLLHEAGQLTQSSVHPGTDIRERYRTVGEKWFLERDEAEILLSIFFLGDQNSW